MSQYEIIEEPDPAQTIYPDMPCYVANEAEFIAAVDVGLADIEAGRTVPFDVVAAKLRRGYGGM